MSENKKLIVNMIKTDKGCFISDCQKRNNFVQHTLYEVIRNLKMLGRNIDKFMCKKCLIKFLDINEDRWDKYIEEFKATGCNLF